MSRWLVPLFAVLAAPPALAQDQASRSPEQLIENARFKTGVDADGCLLSYRRDTSDEIIVCGMRTEDRRYRLPLPQLAVEPGKRNVLGEIPAGDASIVKKGACYVDNNELNCFKGVTLLSIGGNSGRVTGIGAKLWDTVRPPEPKGDFAAQEERERRAQAGE